MDVDDATSPSKAAASKADAEVLTLDDSSDAEMSQGAETKAKKGKGKEKDAGKGTKRKSEGALRPLRRLCWACGALLSMRASLAANRSQQRVETDRGPLSRSLFVVRSLGQKVQTFDVQVGQSVVLEVVEQGRRR